MKKNIISYKELEIKYADPNFVEKVSKSFENTNKIQKLKLEEIIKFAEETYKTMRNIWPVKKDVYINYVIKEYEKASQLSDEEFKEYIKEQSNYAIVNLQQMYRRLHQILVKYKRLPFHKKIWYKIKSFFWKKEIKKSNKKL